MNAKMGRNIRNSFRFVDLSCFLHDALISRSVWDNLDRKGCSITDMRTHGWLSYHVECITRVKSVLILFVTTSIVHNAIWYMVVL